MCEILIERLKRLGVPKGVLKFIFNIVHSRNLIINFDNINEHRRVGRGLPQGSVLSPLLYSLYVRELVEVVSDCRNLKILQFADDVCIYTAGPRPERVVNSLEIGANRIEEWFNLESGLSLAPNKSILCVFSRSLSTRKHQWSITVDGSIIRSQHQAKFLGITFQDNLKWNKHVDALINTCVKPLGAIGYLRSTWWGADPTLLLRFFKELIRSRLEYGAFIWHQLPNSVAIRLDRIQFKAIRLALGYQSLTPTSVLMAESGIPPLEVRVDFLCKNFLVRITACENHSLTPRLAELSERHISPTYVANPRFPKLRMVKNYDFISEYAHLIHSAQGPEVRNYPYTSMINPIAVYFEQGRYIQKSSSPGSKFESIFRESQESAWFFTDGSKGDDPEYAGFAAYNVENGIITKSRISRYASIFSLEALAMIIALESALYSPKSKVYIFSDSMSVLQALSPAKSWANKSYLILEIKRRIYDLKERNRLVHLFWIPSHVGIRGNEMVDQAAKLAVHDGVESNWKLLHSDFRSCWRKNAEKEFINYCRNIGEIRGLKYFDIFYKECKVPWFHGYELNRKTIVSICRLRAGHTSLRECLYKKKVVETPMCECEQSIQSADHIFWQCPLFDQEREILYRALRKLSNFRPFSVDSLLANLSIKVIDAISQYVCSISINI